jgi:hypothetical protein
VSRYFGDDSQAAHRETAFREEQRQEKAERAHAEGWDEGTLGEEGPVPHYAGDPFCECETCRGR